MTITDDAPTRVEPDVEDAVPDYAALPDDQKRDAARELARRDADLTGAELGRMFGKEAWWGRDQARIGREGSRRGKPVDAPPQYDPPAPAVEAPRRVNGTVRTTAPKAPQRPPRPASPKAAAPAPTEPRPATSGAVHAVTVLGVLVVAAIAAILSYAHMRHLAIDAGEGWRADLLPLSVDGMMVVASMTLLKRRRQRARALLAWAGLLLGAAASLAANVAAAQPTVEGRLIAAWPPVALLLAFELLLQQGRPQTDRKDGT